MGYLSNTRAFTRKWRLGGGYKDGLVRLCHHEMEVSKQIMMWAEFMIERAVRKAVEAEGEPGWM